MTTYSVTHKVTGEQITFLETTQQTGGKYLYIEVSLPPFGKGPPLHVHTEFEEAFEVITGKLEVQVNKNKHELNAGEKIKAPIGTAHTFNNPYDQPVTFRVKLTPPSQFEQSVLIHYGLMDDGLTDEKGNPKTMSHLATILYLQNTWVAGIPIWLQKIVIKRALKKGLKKGELKQLEKYTAFNLNL